MKKELQAKHQDPVSRLLSEIDHSVKLDGTKKQRRILFSLNGEEILIVLSKDNPAARWFSTQPGIYPREIFYDDIASEAVRKSIEYLVDTEFEIIKYEFELSLEVK